MIIAAAALLVVISQGVVEPPAADTLVAVRTVRFYQPESRGTQVAAFVDWGLRGGRSVSLRIIDSSGVELWDQSWTATGLAEFYPSDHLRFAIGPGLHRIEVSVWDDDPRRGNRTTLTVRGFESPPVASDLLLAPRIRGATWVDTLPTVGEFRRGNSLVSAAAAVILRGEDPEIHYLLEVYSEHDRAGTLVVWVEEGDGTAVRRAAPVPVELVGGVGIITGQVALDQIESGSYQLVLELDVGEEVIRRRGGFAVERPVVSPF